MHCNCRSVCVCGLDKAARDSNPRHKGHPAMSGWKSTAYSPQVLENPCQLIWVWLKKANKQTNKQKRDRSRLEMVKTLKSVYHETCHLHCGFQTDFVVFVSDENGSFHSGNRVSVLQKFIWGYWHWQMPLWRQQRHDWG